MTPHGLLSLQLRWTAVLIEAQAVMGLRMLGLTGVIPGRPGEALRMIAEKGPALGQSMVQASDAMMRGKGPEEVAIAAMVPIGRKVRSNHKRLRQQRTRSS